MHDIIDIAKGGAKIKIPYLKGKKEKMKERERIKKFIKACEHSFNIFIHAIY